ncbi:MAG: hypothetical protein Q9191_007299, partial [Dirinaria sp. TL-2023a]
PASPPSPRSSDLDSCIETTVRRENSLKRCALLACSLGPYERRMSTIRSSPSGSRQPSRATGFNDHSYDPFFPSSLDDEQLFQVAAAELSPNPQPHPASLSPALPNGSAAALTPPQNNYTNGLGHSQSLLTPVHQQATPSQTLQDPFTTETNYEFLSPNTYISENGYTESSEHTGSPDYGDDFYRHLENDFGWLSGPDFPGHLASQPGDETRDEDDFRDREISDPVSTTTHKSHDTNATRTSLGTATLSSHLMSPILTDIASPGSGVGQESPLADERDLKAEAAANTVLNSGDNMAIGVSGGPGGSAQQTTPALTGSSRGTRSSNGTSPDRFTRLETAPAASPVVRIESYSRGDSPARSAGLARAASKRSHGSSHLAVEPDVGSLEDGERFEVHDAPGTHADSPVSPTVHGRPLDASHRVGLDPHARLQVDSDEIPNFHDQDVNAETALRMADVQEWLAQSEASSEVQGEAALPSKPLELPTFSRRQRAKSTGDSLSRENLESFRGTRRSPADFHIPGPGVLIDEESGDEDDEDLNESDEEDEHIDRPASPPAAMHVIDQGAQNSEEYSIANPAIERPPLYRLKLWEDPLYDSTNLGVKAQPGTSNEAMYKFEQKAAELETLSRAATWGTRRVSDGDLASVLHRMSISSQAEAGEKAQGSRRGTFLEQAAAKLRPKRSGSMLKRKESGSPRLASRPATLEHSKQDSSGSLGLPRPLQRVPSLGKKPKSPRINTGSAVAAMISVASLGAGTSGPVSASATPTPTSPWASAKNTMKRSRSRSDLPKGTGSSTNLTELWMKQGGPPMPALAASQKEETKSIQAEHSEELEDDDEEGGDEKGIVIDLTLRGDPIIPTLEGFKANVKELNPRLPLFMIERISQEQLRRYKKLVEFKVKHLQATTAGKCGSGKHCLVQGGEPTYVQSKSNTKEPDWSQTGFSVAGLGQSDDDVNALEGAVTPAQFPPGVPMPPVKRLPAEFECSLCFKVKKFHKPSDWSKHVHEDVQPFTCTFVNCAEPKSFKRKADWVRHENERHRQLEWWSCSYNDCNHTCYRKDNFVQHLVREHKLPEPKMKTAKASKPAVRGPSAQKARRQMEEAAEKFPDEIDQVWKLVEACRYETQKNPKDEACKFCGNICNSWKKLTVHLSKHMEQISMPVIGIVEKKDVTPETIISPIEQRSSNQPVMSPLQSPFPHPASSVSNYGMPSTGMASQFAPMQPPAAYYPPNMVQGPTVSRLPGDMSATYPPQIPHSTPSSRFPPPHANLYSAESYPSYDAPTTASFMPVDSKLGPVAQSQSPENLYNSMHTIQSAQSHPARYAQTGPFLPPTPYQQEQQQQQQQQQYFSTAADPSSYGLAGSPRVTPFSQGAPTSAPMQYNPGSHIGFSQVSGGNTLFQHEQRQSYGY